MVLPILGWGALALGGATIGGARALKDEVGLGNYDAAQHELQQPSQKGYNTKTGKTKVGIIEGFNDWWLDRDRAEIDRMAQEGHVENLKLSTEGKKVLKARPGFEIDKHTTNEDVTKKLTEIERRDPLVARIMATNEVGGDYTREELQGMDRDSLLSLVKKYTNKEKITDDNNNPVTQRAIENARQDRITSDKRWNATQQMQVAQMGLAQQQQANQMQIAQMNNQLERRRMDMADRRTDRRDRQAMIQQLMGGLSALGTSIAI